MNIILHWVHAINGLWLDNELDNRSNSDSVFTKVETNFCLTKYQI